MSRIYLDNAATTWPDPAVLQAMGKFNDEKLGNASSIHRLGVRAATEVEKARAVVAAALGAKPEEIVFTSGGTESNNLALQGYLYENAPEGGHLIVSAIEHASVLETARWLSTRGYEVSFLPVDREGFCDPAALRSEIRPDTVLVSVMQGNNEVGTIQDLEALGEVCAKKRVAFHSDACQSFTKTPFLPAKAGVALASLSGHKIHGPRGIGALYVREGTRLAPLFRGGSHEGGLRPGTSNSEGMVGFAAAVKAAAATSVEAMADVRDFAIREILASVPGAALNGPEGRRRLCNNVNVSFRGVSSKDVLFGLDRRGISVSAGSACAASKKQPSHVLLAMGRDDAAAAESVRISLSKWTTREEIRVLVEALGAVVSNQGGKTDVATA